MRLPRFFCALSLAASVAVALTELHYRPVSDVPEPGTLLMLITALGALLFCGMRARFRNTAYRCFAVLGLGASAVAACSFAAPASAAMVMISFDGEARTDGGTTNFTPIAGQIL